MELISGLSIISVVLLIGWMLYFLLGGIPLLTLPHDKPVDAHFVMRFFAVHYQALVTIAVIGALCFVYTARYGLAAELAWIGVVGLLARQLYIFAMVRLGGAIEQVGQPARQRFRLLHASGLALNVMQLVLLVSVVGMSQIERCIEPPPSCQDAASGVPRPDCRRQCSLLAAPEAATVARVP